MLIYPAIDLMDGKCVRLQEGRFETTTVYAENPLEMAATFKAAGATWIHIVDLDGARSGEPCHTELIAEISRSTGLKVQTGGGIRTEERARAVLEKGIDRVILGSMAVAEPAIVDALIKDFGTERIVLALDVIKEKAGYVVRTHGWQRSSGLLLRTAMGDFRTMGALHTIVTDVSRDGMMLGPNMALYNDLALAFCDVEVQASGGVSTLGQIKVLEKCGIRSAIVGKAIYEGELALEDLFDGPEQC